MQPVAGSVESISLSAVARRRLGKLMYCVTEQCSYAAALVLPPGARLGVLIARVKDAPTDIFRWTDLASACPDVDAQTKRLIRSHRLRRSNLHLVRSSASVTALVAPGLMRLAADLRRENACATLTAAIEEIVRWTTIERCRADHDGYGGPNGYFAVAETVMQTQWEKVVFPIIRDCDFTSTLELGCGYGRNVERLRHLAKAVILVDVNQSCLDACQRRFGAHLDGCSFLYCKTAGNHLKGVDDASITFLYCWDTMVHFDKLVVRDYMTEIARVLRPGGRAFLHYSNLGATRPDSAFFANDGHRSDMSGEIMFRYATEIGFSVVSHRLSGRADGWGLDDLDCLTLLQR